MTDTEMNEFCARELLVDCKGPVANAAELHPKYMLDFLTSESANALLLEKMAVTGVDVLLGPTGVTVRVYRTMQRIPQDAIEKYGSDRKRAIVLAFIEWRKHA